MKERLKREVSIQRLAEARGIKLRRVGIFRKSGHEHLRGSLVIPMVNLEGDVVQLYGRKVNDNLREGTEYHLYLPGPMRGVWNVPRRPDQDAAITRSTLRSSGPRPCCIRISGPG